MQKKIFDAQISAMVRGDQKARIDALESLRPIGRSDVIRAAIDLSLRRLEELDDVQWRELCAAMAVGSDAADLLARNLQESTSAA